MNALVLLLLTGLSWAKVSGDLKFFGDNIKQGDIVSAKMILSPLSVQKFSLQALKGSTVGKTLYFLSLSTPLRIEGSETFESDVKVIFLKVPEKNTVSDVIQNEEVQFQWAPINIQPTQAEKGLIFGQFSVPERFKVFFWAVLILSCMVLLGIGFLVYRRFKEKKAKKEKLKKLKSELFNCANYEQLVELWKKKKLYVENFPFLADGWQELEKVLFQFMFKPTPSSSEKASGLEAHKRFLKSIEGKFDGI